MKFFNVKEKYNVYIFNPSSPPELEKFDMAIKFIKRYPVFNIIAPENVVKKRQYCDYLYNSPEENARKFMELSNDFNIDAIWCSRGGYGILKWLKYIYWDELEKSHKFPLIIGFSDVTFLHSCISGIGKFSLHAPLFTTFPHSSDKSKEYFFDAFKGILHPIGGKIFKAGNESGKLIGGNMTCIIHTIGTRFEPKWDESILFLEDHNEAPYRIDRMLTHLLLSGRLDRVKGICFGEFYCKNEKIDLYEVLKITLNNLNIPIIFDIKAGHGKENYPLLIGGRYTIDGFRGILKPECCSLNKG